MPSQMESLRDVLTVLRYAEEAKLDVRMFTAIKKTCDEYLEELLAPKLKAMEANEKKGALQLMDEAHKEYNKK